MACNYQVCVRRLVGQGERERIHVYRSRHTDQIKGIQGCVEHSRVILDALFDWTLLRLLDLLELPWMFFESVDRNIR